MSDALFAEGGRTNSIAADQLKADAVSLARLTEGEFLIGANGDVHRVVCS